MVNGKIYEVNFITHNSRRQISLVETTDTMPLENETVLALSGESLGGKMFWYNGTQWIQSQEKTGVNQAPLFDVFDHDGIILNDQITYPASDFIGNKIFTFITRFILGIKLSDILYTYVLGRTSKFKKLNISSNDFRFCVEFPIKIEISKMNYISIPSYEKKRIGGNKKVNEIRDGFLILIEMLKLFVQYKILK